jgi:hypothetical protein
MFQFDISLMYAHDELTDNGDVQYTSRYTWLSLCRRAVVLEYLVNFDIANIKYFEFQ